MVGTSKILTVSYGTFSCTLEGFDDSFNTMKAIAEYFRDLAADDRYFGAEPPTPDAEMLARIAEKEIARRVEARTEATGIVLRAAHAPAEAQAQPAATSPALANAAPTASIASEAAPVAGAAPSAALAAAISALSAQDDKPASAPAAPTPVTHDDAVSPDAAEDSVQYVAAEATTDAEPPQLTPEDLPDATMPEMDMPVDASDPTTADAEAAAPEPVGITEEEAESSADTPVADIDPLTDQDDVAGKEESAENADKPWEMPAAAASVDADEGSADADIATTQDALSPDAAAPLEPRRAEMEDDANDVLPQATPEPVEEEPAAAAALPVGVVPAHPDPSSVAAKLQRIRAVVGQSDKDDFDGAYTEDLSQDVTLPSADTQHAPSEMMPSAAFADDPEDNVDETPARSTTAPGTDMIARVMARHESQDIAEGDLPADPPAQTVEDEASESPAPDPSDALRVKRVSRAELEAALAELDDEDADEAEAEMAIGAGSQRPDLADLDGADEFEDEYDGDALSPEEEAEFLRALSDLDDEPEDDLSDSGVMDHDTAPNDADDTDQADPEEAASPEPAASPERPRGGRDLLSRAPDTDEEDLARLLSETDAQLNEPEGNRRRSAIEQLKAAVAANEASRKPDAEQGDDASAETAFREDLSQVVRPRRAQRPTEHRTERPRPAPLTLVASQRVDLPDDSPPVRPRRVVRTEPQADAASFADFALKMGAHELPDLLEAAGAYTSFVEGAEEFSRPQILRRVRAIAPDDFNREDGLRSFANLLREGRFTKVRNGRFQVADDTRFHPERRAS